MTLILPVKGSTSTATGSSPAERAALITRWTSVAAVAQHEREIISARTSDALKAAKAQGKRLGNPNLSEARRHAAVANKERADRYSTNVLPVICEIRGS